MTRSRRTTPLEFRSSDDEPARIKVLKPRPGDRHPISSAQIREILERVPTQFLYGLKQIELRGRNDNQVGYPYAKYIPVERKIIVFSVPEILVWYCGRADVSVGLFGEVTEEAFGARVKLREGSRFIKWPDHHAVMLFYSLILLHELGHHFTYRSRTRRGLPGDNRNHESLADLHALRLFQIVYEGREAAALGDCLALVQKQIHILECPGK